LVSLSERTALLLIALLTAAITSACELAHSKLNSCVLSEMPIFTSVWAELFLPDALLLAVVILKPYLLPGLLAN
jgi:hypothetical protein